ncbi:MAG: hypothetical protein ABI390_04185 [Daejeonella sp.]
MKKLIFAMMAGIVICLAFCADSSAQIMLPQVNITRPRELTKVELVFKQMFKGADEPKWFYRNNRFIASFRTNKVKNNALFNYKGKLLQLIRYGTKEMLPKSLIRLVENAFWGYQIIAVTNVNQNGKSTWFITGEGSSDFMQIVIEDGILSEPTYNDRFATPKTWTLQTYGTDLSTRL